MFPARCSKWTPSCLPAAKLELSQITAAGRQRSVRSGLHFSFPRLGLLMLHRIQSTLCTLVVTASLAATCHAQTTDETLARNAVQVRSDDRVVLLGDGLIEQEQYFGWCEAVFSAAATQPGATFRNIGWNADTPDGKSRLGLSLVQAGREPEGEGWRQLKGQLELTKPSLLVIGYGMGAALDSSAWRQVTGDGEVITQSLDADITAFSSDYQRLLDAAKEINPEVRFLLLTPLSHLDSRHRSAAAIAAFSAAVHKIGQENDAPVIDLQDFARDASLRKDAVHLNEAGYRALAAELASLLGFDSGAMNTPAFEALRQQIIRKNQWWFHRSRPANMAYVFGFRKHEQGQNAVEIPQFDALIEQEEKRIAKLSRLDASELAPQAERLESKFAEFTEQTLPEFTVHPDWEISLWAQNPMLNKPIHMNFDAAGRLWVVSSEAYPMIEVGQSAPDKVVVLEDSAGDGKADKASVFADGLLIPTGVAPGDGGVYVAQSTDLLFLKDTDGDGTADIRRRVLSGFGTEDTHHNLHTLHWGPDGRLYMNQSVYTRTDTETPEGVVRLRAGGGFRLNTESLQTEIHFRGLWNSWGHQFDRFGQSFLSDGAGFAGLAYAFPGATFHPTPGAAKRLDLISPGNWPKFASLEILGGAAYPDEWQGSAITCDFRANRVTRFSLADDGAGFVTKQEADLVRTSAATFRPIDVKQGPDGAIYIADWSNPIINHGEVDFRDSRRDRWHGRIWRLRYTGGQAMKKSDLTQATTSDLLENLLDSDTYLRQQSRRVLANRSDALEKLDDWLGDDASPTAKLEVLWLTQAAGEPRTELAKELLASDDPRIVSAAARVVGQLADPLSDEHHLAHDLAKTWLSEAIKHDHPRVRLEAIRALAKLRTPAAVVASLAALDAPTDRFIEHALWLSVNEVAEPLILDLGYASLDDQLPLDAKKLEFVLTNVKPELAQGFLGPRLAAGGIPEDGSGPWIDLIGSAGGPKELRALMDAVVSEKLNSAGTERALESLAQAQRLRKLKPSGDLKPMLEFVREADTTSRVAIGLLGSWKVPGAETALGRIITESDNRQSQLAAVAALRSLGSGRAIETLKSKLGELSDPVRRSARMALVSLKPKSFAGEFLEELRSAKSESAAIDLWRQALRTRGAGAAIASELAEAKIPELSIVAGNNALRDGGRNEPELAAILQSLAPKQSVVKWNPDRMGEYLSAIKDASPERGEQIYRRAELACTSCHAIGGVGAKVGPDMTSLGASAPADYIVQSLFDPNAKVKEGYHAVTVATEDGQVYTGIEVESAGGEIVLRDANNRITKIPEVEIIGKKAASSLMPTGVVDRLDMSEQADLLRFLTELGKPGRYDATAGNFARVTEVFAGTHRIEQQGAERITNGEIEKGWKPLVALTDGRLPKEELVRLTKQPINIALVHVYVRSRLTHPVDGKMAIIVNSPHAAAWIDGKQIDGGSANDESRTFEAELESGDHTLIVRLDARDLPPNLRISGENTTFAHSTDGQPKE